MRLLSWILLSCVFSSPVLAGEVKEVVSDGGIKAWLMEEHSLPLIAVHVAFRGAGSAHDGDRLHGLAYMTSRMLTEGAGGMDAQQFAAALESRAIGFDAAVDEDLLEASMQMLSDTRDDAFRYLGLALTEPRFDGDALERVRRRTLSELKDDAKDPGRIAEREWRKRVFGDHPYGHMVSGSEEGVGRLDRYDLRHFAEKHLTRENMLVAVVGDITPEALKSLLDKTFGDLPKRYRPEVTVPEASPAATAKPVTVAYDVPQTVAVFGLPAVRRDDPEFMAAYLMNQILGGNTLTGRLGHEIRDKRGLAYGVSSSLRTLMHAAYLSGAFATRNEEAGQAAAVLVDTLKAFARSGPGEQELLDAKRYAVGSLAINLDGNDAIAGFLITMQHQALGIDYLKRRERLIEAVTGNEVKAAAKRLIDADKLSMVLVGKPEPVPGR